MKEEMIINNFRLIDTNADPNASIYCYKDIEIASFSTKILCDVYEKVNKDIFDASEYFSYENSWISAVYTNRINPSQQKDYESFIKDLELLVSNYKNEIL